MNNVVKGVLILLFCLFVSSPAWATQAAAVIKGTTEGSQVSGTVTITALDEGIEIDANVANVSPGKHGFHIHEFGSCDDTGKAAGGHYNPMNVQHGLVTKDGMEHAHCGDFGNIEVGADGTGHLKVFVSGLSIEDGEFNVAGRAFILHEKEDDFGQPTGNAGGRIGCGPIVISGN